MPLSAKGFPWLAGKFWSAVRKAGGVPRTGYEMSFGNRFSPCEIQVYRVDCEPTKLMASKHRATGWELFGAVITEYCLNFGEEGFMRQLQ